MTTVLEKFSRFVETHHLLNDGNILLAVSGGADSSAMAHIFSEYKKKNRRISLFVCHVHHHIRSNAERDAEVARDIAQRIRSPFILRHLTPPERPTESWAREARYRVLFETALKLGCSTVATAHTMDDQAETIIMRIIRGAGVDGLKGILLKSSPFESVTLVRPLLCFRKSELREYAEKHSLPVVLDPSNYDVKILRNRIRHHLIPLLESEYRRGSVEALSRLALSVQTAGVYEVEPVKRSFFGYVEYLIPKESIRGGNGYSFRKALRKALLLLSGKDSDLSQEVVLRILNAVLAEKPLRTPLVKGFVAEVIPEGVVLYHLSGAKPQEIPMTVSGSTWFDTVRFTSTVFPLGEFDIEGFKRNRSGNKTHFVEFFDADKGGEELFIRRVRRGERFQPLGMSEEMKVYRFFIKQGVSRRLREYVPLVVSKDDRPLWLVPFRIDRRFAIDQKTKTLLRIEVMCEDTWAL
ncbi:MAG: tRNA lysidine(34) synthetase TilS [Planctomycetota bacterium]|nr:tRNA lysidine(34) synthetase TilS [Planctomycetota bacterium]